MLWSCSFFCFWIYFYKDDWHLKWAGVALGLGLAFVWTLIYDGLHIQGRWGVVVLKNDDSIAECLC